MPCAFHLDHHERSGSGCQFGVSDDRLITFAGQTWCPFHLPMEVEGEASEKAAWRDDEQKIKKFNEDIFAFVRDAKQRGEMADLAGTVFPGTISLESFSGENDALPPVLFLEASFGGNAWFAGASFGGNAWFAGASFGSIAMFDGASFDGVAVFERASFGVGAWFQRASFGGHASFADASFDGHALFQGARFGDAAIFVHASFAGPADFSGSASHEAEAGGQDSFFRASFENATFGRRARFSNRRFLDTTSFRKTVFEFAPEFHNCVLHQDTDFAGADFQDHTDRGGVDAARAYRTLKLAMEQLRNRDEQARFFRHEQRARRLRPDTPRALKAISWLYEKTADYGESPVRPLLWLLAAFLVFSGLYFLAQGGPGAGASWHWPELGATLRFALQQVFLPFRVFIAEPPVPLLLGLLGALHSLLNLGLLALFVIALRRKFRLG